MHEMHDLAQQEEETITTGSTIVSFPDHYLVPYIQRCKRSKYITCGCSIVFIGLAIFCFFATNYMINYPVTKDRKIAFVFGGVFCLVAAFSCLGLRFRLTNQCRDDDTVLFEITRIDSDTLFYGPPLRGQEAPLSSGNPPLSKEGSSQEYTPENFPSRTHSLDEPCRVDSSTSRHNGLGPRNSISDGVSPDTLLLPPRSVLDVPTISRLQNGMESMLLQNNRTHPGNDNHSRNYFTFENGNGTLENRPLLLAESNFENGHDVTEAESPLAESNFENGYDVSEAESRLGDSNFENGCDASDTAPLLE